jgi:hypothetical protein
MSVTVYSVHGGVVNNNERVFDSEYTLMFADSVRVSHMYFSGGNLCVAVNVPSIDFLTFEVTDVVQGPGGQVWVRPATVEEVSERLFIQDGGDAPEGFEAVDPIDCSNGCPDHDPILPLPSFTDLNTPVNLGTVPRCLAEHDARLRVIENCQAQRTHHFQHHPGDVMGCKTCAFESRPLLQPEPPDVIDRATR